MTNPPHVIVAPRVAEALAARRPVVALETTLVTHGFPHPEGLEVAVELEAAVTAEGAQPATIGIVDGRIHVGLGHAELEQLATGGRAAKLNLSNLAAHLTVDRRFDDVGLLAEAVRAHLALNIGTGVVVANPVAREHELPRERWQPAIERALADASRQAIRGRDVTPFLLERLRVMTEGASVFSNRALLVNNATLAGRLAGALRRE